MAIIRSGSGLDAGRLTKVVRSRAAPLLAKVQQGTQQLISLRQIVRQPVMPVLGVLMGAGAAKGGHGEWAAGGTLVFVLIHFSAVATAILTRSLAAWVARMRRYEKPALAVAQIRNVTPRHAQRRRQHPTVVDTSGPSRWTAVLAIVLVS